MFWFSWRFVLTLYCYLRIFHFKTFKNKVVCRINNFLDFLIILLLLCKLNKKNWLELKKKILLLNRSILTLIIVKNFLKLWHSCWNTYIEYSGIYSHFTFYFRKFILISTQKVQCNKGITFSKPSRIS